LSTTEERAWERITGHAPKLGRAGIIPIYDDGTWRLIHNSHTIWPNVEFAADPAKVDKLRQNVNSLLEKYPETIPQLEKLGIRVKALLKRPIENPTDVQNWAEFIFNTGPVTGDPVHVEDAKALAYDDYWIQVKGGRHPIYVLPVGPRGSSSGGTVDFSVPGSKTKYGARHDYSKIAFSQQAPESLRSDPERSTASGTNGKADGPARPRGRPRKDGLIPGSPEAKEADRIRKEAAEEARRAKLEQKSNGKSEPVPENIVPMPPRRRLVRVGAVAQAT